ncbi:hypothetical protein MKX01_005334 [Papaver californicum]|nr:hypothetical protein MKX01_005334 [Papaver californicum]
MFMKTALRDIIPPELYKATRSIFFYFFSNLQTKTVTVHIKEFVGRYDYDIFKSIQRYLSSKCFASSQYLTLSKMKNSKNPTYTMIPNQGILDISSRVSNSLGIKFTWSFRTEDSNESGSNGKSTNYFEICFEEKYKEFVNSSYLVRIAEEAKLIKSKNKGKKFYTNQTGDGWTMISQFSHPLTQDDLKKFVSSKEFYTRVGKAWKRGYLLYGPPGTGKTSLIDAIANYLGFDIYDLDESDSDKNTKNGVSNVILSGLINFVDGLWSPCAGERLIIFTANHKEKLDPALLRAGRMNKHILLSYHSLKVLTRNYLRIQEHELMNEVEDLLSLIQITTADVAECLMSFDEYPDMGMRYLVAQMYKRLIQNLQGSEETKMGASNKGIQNTKKMIENGNESDGYELADELDSGDELTMVTTNMTII